MNPLFSCHFSLASASYPAVSPNFWIFMIETAIDYNCIGDDGYKSTSDNSIEMFDICLRNWDNHCGILLSAWKAKCDFDQHTGTTAIKMNSYRENLVRGLEQYYLHDRSIIVNMPLSLENGYKRTTFHDNNIKDLAALELLRIDPKKILLWGPQISPLLSESAIPEVPNYFKNSISETYQSQLERCSNGDNSLYKNVLCKTNYSCKLLPVLEIKNLSPEIKLQQPQQPQQPQQSFISFAKFDDNKPLQSFSKAPSLPRSAAQSPIMMPLAQTPSPKNFSITPSGRLSPFSPAFEWSLESTPISVRNV